MSSVCLHELDINALEFGPIAGSTHGGIFKVFYKGKPAVIRLPKVSVSFDTSDYKKAGDVTGNGKYVIVVDATELDEQEEANLLAIQEKMWMFVQENLADVQALGGGYDKYNESRFEDEKSARNFMNDSTNSIISSKKGSSYKNIKIKLNRKKTGETFTNMFRMDKMTSEWDIAKVTNVIKKGAYVECYVALLGVFAMKNVGISLFADTVKVESGSGDGRQFSDDENEAVEDGENDDDDFGATVRKFEEDESAEEPAPPVKVKRARKEDHGSNKRVKE